MDLTKVFKKQTAIIAVSVIGLSLILLGTSYALFFRVNQSTEQQVVSTGTLTVQIPNPQSRLVADLMPKSAGEVDSSDTYTFTVSNTGTLPMKYEVIIYNDKDETLTNSLDHQYLYISFDGGTAKKLSECTRTADTADIDNQNNIKYVLKSDGELAASGETGSSATHYVQIWLDENAPAAAVNKTIDLEIAVNGEVNEE